MAAALGDFFQGSATITSLNGQPLAAVVHNFFHQPSENWVTTYVAGKAQYGAQYLPYVSRVTRVAGGWDEWSAVSLQNLSDEPATAQIYFYRPGSAAPVLQPDSLTIAAREVWSLNTRYSPSIPSIPITALGNDFRGSMRVISDKPLAVVVALYGNPAWGAAYTGVVSSGEPVLQAPQLAQPAAGSVITTSMPVFSWKDPDDLAVQYTLRVNDDSHVTPVAAVPDQTEYSSTWATELSDGGYHWTVEALSPLGQTARPDEFAFTVDTSPPERPELLSPEDGEQVPGTQVRLEWTSCEDADRYEVIVNEVVVATTPETSYTYSSEADECIWTVVAFDDHGNCSEEAESRTFTFTGSETGDAKIR